MHSDYGCILRTAETVCRRYYRCGKISLKNERVLRFVCGALLLNKRKYLYIYLNKFHGNKLLCEYNRNLEIFIEETERIVYERI